MISRAGGLSAFREELLDQRANRLMADRGLSHEGWMVRGERDREGKRQGEGGVANTQCAVIQFLCSLHPFWVHFLLKRPLREAETWVRLSPLVLTPSGSPLSSLDSDMLWCSTEQHQAG